MSQKIGFKHTQSSKDKISEGHRGEKNGKSWKGGLPKCLDCGKLLTNYNNKRCNKCSHIISRGIKSNLWKGGISSENQIIRHSIEFRLWREAVFARDNWTCQKYGIRNNKLHPHHIRNFAEEKDLRFAIDNGITLSDIAHREFHKRYGVKNNTKSQIEEFLLK